MKMMLAAIICYVLSGCLAQETPESIAWPAGTALDYVTLGDSITRESQIPELYASRIQDDLGVEVTLHNKATPGESAAETLRRIRSPEELRHLVADAEIITINVAPSGWNLPERFFLAGDCGGDDNQACLREHLDQVQSDWEFLLDEVLVLRSSQHTIIRVLTVGTWIHHAIYRDHLAFSDKVDAEKMDIMLAYFLQMNDFAAESASQRGVPVVDLGREFQGQDYENEVPQEHLWLDGIHLSEDGSSVVADLLGDLGYDPISQ
jgi:hypothetical protein